MIGSSSPLPEVGGGGGGGCGPPPLLCRRLPDMRRFILGSLSLAAVTTLPSEEQDEELIGIDADCWMRILELGLELPPGVGS